MVKRILPLVTCLFVLMGASDPYGLALREARHLRQEKRYEAASQAYEAALASGLCSTVRKDALLELATCYQATKLWDQAIELYWEVIDDPGASAGMDTSSLIAEWNLAECLFEKREYRSALDELRRTRGRYPFGFGCGNASVEQKYEQRLRESILNEYLGQYDTAVSGYFRMAEYDRPGSNSLRLWALYKQAGQLPDLLRLVEEADRRYAESRRKYREGCQNGGYCPPEHCGLYRTIQGILEIQELGDAGDWQALLTILEPERPGAMNAWTHGWSHPEYELREAARLLAQHEKETMPLLLPYALKRGYYAYALGLTGAPEALAVLKEEAKKEKNYYQLFALVDDLLAAGPEGVAALESLYPGAQENLKLLIDRYRQGTLDDFRSGPHGDSDGFPFPPIPESIRLPNHCTYDGPPGNEYRCTFMQKEPAPEATGKMRF